MSSILEDAHDLCILIDLKLAECSLPRPESECYCTRLLLHPSSELHGTHAHSAGKNGSSQDHWRELACVEYLFFMLTCKKKKLLLRP